VAVPPYVHALSWSTLLFRLAAIGRLQGLALPTSGPVVAGFVLAMARMPLAYGMASVALALLPDEALEAGRNLRANSLVLARIVLPLAAPVAASGLALAFLLSLLDYSVPALFQVNVLPLGVFADYSATGDAARAVAMSLPLILAASLACLALVAGWRRAALKPPGAASDPDRPALASLLSPAFRRLAGLAMLLLLVQALGLLAGLLVAAGSPAGLKASVAPIRSDLTYSLLVALAAALLSIGPALALALGLATPAVERPRMRLLLWLLTLLPLAIPAPLFGIGLIGFWRTGPLTGALAITGGLLPVFASAGRFAPLAAVLIAAQLLRRDPRLLDAARLHQAGALQGWWRVVLPLTAPGLLAAAGLVYALSLGELGATLMVLPPGRSTLTARTFNYLHYGASEAVAGACLAMALSASIAVWFALRAFESGQRHGQESPH
jgi:iron(III) transport system permease protein